MERTYRKRVKSEGLISFHIEIKETDLWVSAEQELSRQTKDLVFHYRRQIESYIQSHPDFLTSLQPYTIDNYAPPIIRDMIFNSGKAGVGPMASIAGAIAQFAGQDLLSDGLTSQVIIENGGDIFIKANRDMTIMVLAGKSPLSEKFGIKIKTEQMPIGVCSSSGTIGHSLSFGRADVVCTVSSSALLADSAATALGNRILQKSDLDYLADWAERIEGVQGVLAVLGDKMAIWGGIELVTI